MHPVTLRVTLAHSVDRGTRSVRSGIPTRSVGTINFYAISDEINFEDSLLYTADLLHSASATALDCGEQLQSPERAKVLAVWHLLEIAKAMVDRSIECLHPRKT